MSFPFFLEMAWKSAAIAGAALLLVALLRSRAAADRAALLRLAAALLLALPFASLLVPALQVEITAAATPAPAMPHAAMSEAAAPAASSAAPVVQDDPFPLVAILYLGGLLMVGLRLATGLWTLRGWTRRAEEVRCPEWNTAFRRIAAAAGAPSRLRLLVSDEAASPLSWGLRSPVILLDRDALGRPEDAEAVLAHEVAHVVRRDWPALILSRLTVALFWFNPLVWLLERQLVQQAEEAADSQAVARIEPSRYARTLLGCAETAWRSPVPANSIALSTGLGRRVKAVLDGRLRTPTGSGWTRAAMIGTAAFAAPLAALELTEAHPLPPTPPAPPVPAIAPRAPVAPPAPLAAVALQAPPAPPAPATPTVPVPPAPPHREWLSEAEIEAIEAAAEEAGRAAKIAASQAAVQVERAMRQASASMAAGAASMEGGARGMEEGARKMAEEARKLRDHGYRERQIAKAAARGETVTHDDLIEAADGLEEGSRGMLEGAREMRAAAAEMRGRRLH